jgi:hypothetical protein
MINVQCPSDRAQFEQVIIAFVHAVQSHDETDMHTRQMPYAARRELLKVYEGQIERAEVPQVGDRSPCRSSRPGGQFYSYDQ